MCKQYTIIHILMCHLTFMLYLISVNKWDRHIICTHYCWKYIIHTFCKVRLHDFFIVLSFYRSQVAFWRALGVKTTLKLKFSYFKNIVDISLISVIVYVNDIVSFISDPECSEVLINWRPLCHCKRKRYWDLIECGANRTLW